MAATQTVPQYSQHGNFSPITPRHGVVTLSGYGINVHVHRGHLTIQDGIGANRRAARLPRVGHGLRRLVVIGSDGTVSLAALRWLADQDAAFVMLDRAGEVLAVTGPVRPSDARLRRAQSLAPESGAALKIAIELIRQKLIAQEKLVRDRFQNEASADTIVSARCALLKARSSEEIRRYEARAALAYWSAWHDLPVEYSRVDSQRVPEHWKTFGSRLSPLTRSPRLAVNPPNAMLNYLYAILEAEARLSISELGLDPGIGFLHSDTRTRDSLACDLMEPIRPQLVDAFLLDWLRRGPFQRKWFLEERNGNCRLTSECAATLSETSRLWRQALGPLAEWIASTLWSTTSQPSRAKAPATRLTQNRKREAKGIPTATTVAPALRQNPLSAPKPVRLNAHDPIAQARRTETQRRQNAALKAWKPSDKPEWLDEMFYRTKIQPQLHSIQVSQIQFGLSVSLPYASRIREGRCVPHERHWLALTTLVDQADS